MAMSDDRIGYTVHGANHGVIAQGAQARGLQVNYGAPDGQLARLEQLLQELADRVDEYGGPAAADVLDDIDRTRDELHRRKPDGNRMIALLGSVSAAIAPVSSLAELADHIAKLVGLAVR